MYKMIYLKVKSKRVNLWNIMKIIDEILLYHNNKESYGINIKLWMAICGIGHN